MQSVEHTSICTHLHIHKHMSAHACSTTFTLKNLKLRYGYEKFIDISNDDSALNEAMTMIGISLSQASDVVTDRLYISAVLGLQWCVMATKKNVRKKLGKAN